MLTVILSLWIAQSAPVLPAGTLLEPEPAAIQQTSACCCDEKCECGTDCQCQKSEEGKACCTEGTKCCEKHSANGGCCREAKTHACCGSHDQKAGDDAKAGKCCGSSSHCKRDAKGGS